VASSDLLQRSVQRIHPRDREYGIDVRGGWHREPILWLILDILILQSWTTTLRFAQKAHILFFAVLDNE
jgi:hypothetical protein